MAGRRTAKIALGLVIDLAERIAATGVEADCAPGLDEAVDLVWPLACQLARLDKSGRKASKSARRAREAVLDAAVSKWAAGAGQQWVDFDPRAWHLELVPGSAADRQTEAA